MVDLTAVQLPPPKNWQDFERLCRDLFAEEWRDPHTERNGREFQPQHGVDVYGRPERGSSYAGVQCKGRETFFGGGISIAELDSEVNKAKAFEPPLQDFILATTGHIDNRGREHARKLTLEHRTAGLFAVHVMGWDELQARLGKFPAVAKVHYKEFYRDPEPEISRGYESAVAYGGALSEAFLDSGAEHFAESAAQLGVPLPDHAAFEVAVVIPNVGDYVADRRFLSLVTNRGTTRWSGWSLWMNPQALQAPELQPYVIADAWEARVVLVEGDSRWSCNPIDFWRAWPLGRFYHRRALWEDGYAPFGKVSGLQLVAPARDTAVRELDPVYQILHVAEALEVGIRLARVLQKETTTEKIDFAFRWSGLRDRVLVSRFRPGPYCVEQLRCRTAQVPGQHYVHASTDPREIPRVAHAITARLFRAFDGFSFQLSDVETLVQEFFARSR